MAAGCWTLVAGGGTWWPWPWPWTLAPGAGGASRTELRGAHRRVVGGMREHDAPEPLLGSVFLRQRKACTIGPCTTVSSSHAKAQKFMLARLARWTSQELLSTCLIFARSVLSKRSLASTRRCCQHLNQGLSPEKARLATLVSNCVPLAVGQRREPTRFPGTRVRVGATVPGRGRRTSCRR